MFRKALERTVEEVDLGEKLCAIGVINGWGGNGLYEDISRYEAQAKIKKILLYTSWTLNVQTLM